jgi:hypothetical protein
MFRREVWRHVEVKVVFDCISRSFIRRVVVCWITELFQITTYARAQVPPPFMLYLGSTLLIITVYLSTIPA